jgi:hypothetical protein
MQRRGQGRKATERGCDGIDLDLLDPRLVLISLVVLMDHVVGSEQAEREWLLLLSKLNGFFPGRRLSDLDVAVFLDLQMNVPQIRNELIHTSNPKIR